MDLKLVICDIDGTLVSDDKKLLPLSKKMIQTLHDRHIMFGVASGRPVDELAGLALKWGLGFDFDIVIGMNGAELYDGISKQRYDYFKLKKDWIKEIIDILKPFNLNPYMYKGNKILCLYDDENMQNSSKKSNKMLKVAKDISDFYEEDNAKIMFKIDEKRIDKIMEYANKHKRDEYIAFKTQPIMLEFADKRVAKGYALSKFCEMHDIDLSSVMAFGDMDNDISMLETSGFGVCLINGSDTTKKIADDITEKSNNEDGFGYYMQKVLSKL